MEKEWIASYQNGRGECWDLVLRAENYREGLKAARAHQKEYGTLWSFRQKRQ